MDACLRGEELSIDQVIKDRNHDSKAPSINESARQRQMADNFGSKQDAYRSPLKDQ